MHYFDYSALRLEDSFHTSGFFKRESFLVRMLCPPEKPIAGEDGVPNPATPRYRLGENPLANWLRNWKRCDA